ISVFLHLPQPPLTSPQPPLTAMTDPTGASASAGPSTATAVTSSNAPKINLGEPYAFDGNPLKYRTWLRQVQIYLLAKKYTEDTDKILVTLSYMKEGHASTWAQLYFDKKIAEGKFDTWKAFLE